MKFISSYIFSAVVGSVELPHIMSHVSAEYINGKVRL